MSLGDVGKLLRPGADAPERQVFATGRVSAVNVTDRPPTLTIGEGTQGKPVPFTGRISDWHPGDVALYLPGVGLAIAKVPIRGIGEPIEDPDNAEPMEGWHTIGFPDEPQFENSWANLSPYGVAGYYMQPDYWVRLKGVVQSGTTTATIFTLPAGYRPPVPMWFTVLSAGIVGKVRVNTDGAVSMPAGGGNTYASLNGLTFPTRWNPSAWLRPEELNGWSWSTGSSFSDVAFFVRDDGWAWLRGVLTGGTTNTLGLVSPEPARSAWADIHPLAAFGVGRWDHGGGGGTDRNMSAWRQRSGAGGENVFGGANYWSYQAPDSMFTSFTFQNGWADLGGDHRRCAYVRDHFGVVHLHGVATGASKTTDILTTLPAGYRPAERHIYNALESGDTQGRVDVHPDGRVECVSITTGYLSLASISFRAEQ